MLFTWTITIPKNTTFASPVTRDLYLAHGIIDYVFILFPPGCSGLAHCTIHHYAKQIFPSVESQDLSGDTFPREWREYYEMYAEPYVLKFTGWNLDDTYPHKITVSFVVLPRKAILALAIVDAIKGVFGMLTPRGVKIPSWLGGSKE